MDEAKTTKFRFSLLAALTLIILLAYLGISVWAFVTGKATYSEVAASIGPVAGTLVAFWVKQES